MFSVSLNSLIDSSRLGITADISGSPQLRTYYDIHLGKKRNFIGSLFVNAKMEKLPFYSDDVDIGNYNHTFVRGGLAFRQHLGMNHDLGADIYYRNSSLKLSGDIIEVLLEQEYLENFIFRGPEVAFIYQFNTYDSRLYPTRGASVIIKYRQAFNTSSISQFSYPDSLDLENRISETMDPYWHLSALFNIIFVSGNYSTLLDDILSMSDQGRYMGAGAGFTYKTSIGPVSVYLGSRTDLWNPIWYANIGFTF
ncbi:MAG: hypothetical protein KAR16_14200 [Bacteroidales bacterium]|nr:hypothetical protein [Bacteroidales bacterium]